MKQQKQNLPDWVPEALRDDPKKLAFLGALMIIFGIVVLRAFLSGGPSNATAAVQRPGVDPIIANLPLEQTLTGYRPSEEVGINLPMQHWLKERLDLVSRDLFTVRIENFPKLSDKTQGGSGSLVVGTWDENEKSQSFEADQKRKRDALIEALQLEASKLKLQSTMMSKEPLAILDGNVVRVGQTFRSGASDGDFKVVKITARSIVIERDEIRLEIRMQE